MPETFPRIRPRWVQWGLVVGFVLLLEMVTRGGLVSRNVLTSPTEIVSTLAEQAISGLVTPHFIRTMIEVFVSFGIAAILGITIGILFWRFTRLGRVFEPYIVSLYAMPLVMFYPILLILFGLGPTPIVVLTVISAIVPIILNTTIGFVEIREVMHKVARSTRCTLWQTFSKVLFPAATPFIFTGLKLGFIYALVVTIGMEFILADLGLGFQVHQFYDFFKAPSMYAYILINVLIAVVANSLLSRAEESIRRERA